MPCKMHERGGTSCTFSFRETGYLQTLWLKPSVTVVDSVFIGLSELSGGENFLILLLLRHLYFYKLAGEDCASLILNTVTSQRTEAGSWVDPHPRKGPGLFVSFDEPNWSDRRLWCACLMHSEAFMHRFFVSCWTDGRIADSGACRHHSHWVTIKTDFQW